MISKIEYKIREDDDKPISLEWSDAEDDYIITFPEPILRHDLITLLNEIKRHTDWRD